ncbi:Peptidase M48 [Richelia intracellularis HH01]|uniref:Protease HtpX homolog n=1 Tax=Richelia intracellularis HH01 TaxID=1165094 RepID=M1WT70_9NOST|nr:M48 family metalloprotease [Richelia intracellularis]CCH67859.1 Peptidase M48 [Richelia intracellularis HH01]HAE06638.1 protease HtpX [Richelia sp.]
MTNQFKTAVLLATLSGLLITISNFIVRGNSGFILGLILAAGTNLFAWYQSDKIALGVYRAREVSPEDLPRLYDMVDRLSQRANLPMPSIYVVPSQNANAFATGRDPEHSAVAVTEGIMQILTEEELEGVIAHELTHIDNRDTLIQAVAATIAGTISHLGQMLTYSMWFGSFSRDDNRSANPIGIVATAILTPLAATIIQSAISQTREFSADAGAAKLTGNPRALAQALLCLEGTAKQMPISANPAFGHLLIINSLSSRFLGNLFSSHPPTEERVNALLEMEQLMETNY